ncbi:hypothetical protein HMPREF3224_02501 [Anaerococcus hydrogenalis]|nr:hypothetical protein HMPREF3224_02501 [Anaerococcus hydrogenalis]
MNFKKIMVTQIHIKKSGYSRSFLYGKFFTQTGVNVTMLNKYFLNI